MQVEYDDNYNTCKETSAVLSIRQDALDPDSITAQLQLVPTRAWRKGEPAEWKGRPARTGMWMLDTQGNVVSRDLRRHLDWLIGQMHDKREQLDLLRQQGFKIDVFCHWVQLGGTGGPTLSVRNMHGLSALGLEIGFEFWSEDDDSVDEEVAS